MSTEFTIRPFDDSDRDFAAVAQLNNAYFPEHPTTVKEMREEDARREAKLKIARFIAQTPGGGEIVGCGSYEQHIWNYSPGKFSVFVTAAPEKQNAGIGTALYDHVIESLEAHAPEKLTTHVREDLAQSVRFVLQRGYEEKMREWESKLDVQAFDFAPWESAGKKAKENEIVIRSYAEMKGESDCERKMWKLEEETLLDVPSPDPITPLSYDEYLKQILGHPHMLPTGFLVAVHTPTGEFVGTSALWKRGSDNDLNQGLTGVKRDWRRKGIALALKLKTVEVAKAYGAGSIRTENATTNEAMLAINIALGFVRQPAWISYAKEMRPQNKETATA